MGNAWAAPNPLDENNCGALNETLISISDRYVYSKTRCDWVQETVQKYGGSSRYGENAFMPLGVTLPTVQQSLRMHFGVGLE
jgi:hypothetical protein